MDSTAAGCFGFLVGAMVGGAVIAFAPAPPQYVDCSVTNYATGQLIEEMHQPADGRVLDIHIPPWATAIQVQCNGSDHQ